MKIIGATIFALRLPFVEAFSHSTSVRSCSDSVIVRQSLSQLFMPVELDDRLLGRRVIVLVDNLDSRRRAILLITPRENAVWQSVADSADRGLSPTGALNPETTN